jgi:hypothetical protein
MSGENTKVYHKQGGDELVVATGGKITVESGGHLSIAGVDLAAFPTADPTDGVTIWNDNGTLKVATSA